MILPEVQPWSCSGWWYSSSSSSSTGWWWFDLTSFLPREHPLRRLTLLAARPFRGSGSDEEVVDEMIRRLRGGPGAWPVR
jgi:hypothetical protein